MSRFMSEEEVTKVIELFHKGMNTVEIGKVMNRGNTAIGKCLKRNGLKARNIKKKLTYEQELCAVEAYSLGQTTEAVGSTYSVDAVTISNIVKRHGAVVRPRGHVTLIDNPNFFEVIDSEHKAYWLGFIIADGSIVLDQKGRLIFSMMLKSDDEYILHNLKECLGLPDERVKTSNRNEAYIRTSSKEIIKDLAKYGVIPNKTHFSYIPEVPIHLIPHLFRGIFDGDGSVYINDNRLKISIYGTNRLCQQYLDFLKDFLNLKTKSRVYDKVGVSFINFSIKTDVKTIYDFLYSDATIFLKRKKELFDNHLPDANIERASITSLCNA